MRRDAKGDRPQEWAPVFVWDNKKYPGNQELILMGARGLSDDGSIVRPDSGEENDQSGEKNTTESSGETAVVEMKQMTLFDLMKQSSVVRNGGF